MSATTTKILARAAAQPLCDVVVIGVLPNGGGLYLDWNGQTTSSLVMLCQAAIHEATETFIEGLHHEDGRYSREKVLKPACDRPCGEEVF
jgi:hypothetical protein